MRYFIYYNFIPITQQFHRILEPIDHEWTNKYIYCLINNNVKYTSTYNTSWQCHKIKKTEYVCLLIMAGLTLFKVTFIILHTKSVKLLFSYFLSVA